MQIGIVGLGHTGSNVAHRLHRAGYRCVVFDKRQQAVEALAREGALGFGSAEELVMSLPQPRVVWLVLPAEAVGSAIELLAPHLEPGDTIVDASASHYHDDIRRSNDLAPKGIHYVDVGMSGQNGVEHPWCLMIGGETKTVARLAPMFDAIARGGAPARSAGPGAPEPPRGYLHCGPAGAGHFVKMVHDGIERGLMETYAEGFNILQRANAGARASRASAKSVQHPEFYRYDFDVPAIAEVFRHGSVIQSYLLDLAAAALSHDPELSAWGERAAELGAGRWALMAAIEESVPTPILASAVAKRFASRTRS